ncbi:MAG: DNA repair protein RecN [Fibrobacterota bacterium]
MLRSISICNYALIEELETDFERGFISITGETGAGKSIIIGALSLLLGERANTDSIRSGEERSFVEGVFLLEKDSAVRDLLNKAEVPCEEEIIIRREINKKGTNKCMINREKVPLSLLSSIGKWLVDIHGQHEHQYLLNPDVHIEVLDSVSGDIVTRKKYKEVFEVLTNKEAVLKKTEGREAELKKKADYNRWVYDELEKASLSENEYDEIENKLSVLNNSEKIGEACSSLRDITSEEDSGALTLISRGKNALKEILETDPKFKDWDKRLESVIYELEDLSSEASACLSDLSFDPSEIEELNDRAALLRKLMKKHNTDTAGLIALRDSLKNEINIGENFEFEIARLKKECEQLKKDALEKARILSANRKTTAGSLDKAITDSLASLGMSGAAFKTEIDFSEMYLSGTGADRVEFLISSNKGEDFKSLSRTASGGEISRVMLAIKNILAGKDRVPTVVFDEIDAGIGGETANSVGSFIKKLSKHKQVLCITHLHQIASKSDIHLMVMKNERKGRIVTEIKNLDDEARVKEIGRMMGDAESDTVKKHAEKILKNK